MDQMERGKRSIIVLQHIKFILATQQLINVDFTSRVTFPVEKM